MADMNNDPICFFSSLCAPSPPALEEIYLNQTLQEQRGAGTGEGEGGADEGSTQLKRGRGGTALLMEWKMMTLKEKKMFVQSK